MPTPSDDPPDDGSPESPDDAASEQADGPVGTPEASTAPADGSTADASEESTDGTPDGRPPEKPDVSAYTTDERTLTASVQLIWAVRALVSVAVVGIMAGLAATWLRLDPTMVAGGVVVLAVLALVWVHLRYRIWSYRVREDALYLERGVVTNVRTVAPYVRIQHVDTQRGPLERLLGLSTLVVYTAGSRGADVSIPGLTTEEATDLQQRVKELAIEADGGDAL